MKDVLNIVIDQAIAYAKLLGEFTDLSMGNETIGLIIGSILLFGLFYFIIALLTVLGSETTKAIFKMILVTTDWILGVIYSGLVLITEYLYPIVWDLILTILATIYNALFVRRF